MLSMVSELVGQIERIVFTNEENGYTIAAVKVKGQLDLATVVGTILAPTPGEVLEMTGEWVTHPSFGRQFKITQYKSKIPASVNGIKKYLGSGLIRGLGPVMAGRIVKKFKEKTLVVIDDDIERLSEIEGIGPKRIAMIAQAWGDQKDIREVMIFLQSHGVSSGYATKIFKHYGHRSISLLQKNPYRLATDIFGIGFVTADHIAEKLGFPKHSPERIDAGLLYILNQMADGGHVYYPKDLLIARCCDTLGVPGAAVEKAIADAASAQKIKIEDPGSFSGSNRMGSKAVYLVQNHFYEDRAAHRLHLLLHQPKTIRPVDGDAALKWVQGKLSIELAEKQRQAIRCALDNKLMVITGGPGTGKTTIVNAILKIFQKLRVKVLLAAPTGRSAKRLSETAGHRAVTIHRLLEFSFQKGGFQRNVENPLACDLMIVDEASMVDNALLYHLVQAIPGGATFILVGDVDQLPSVGAGNVLGDIIQSGAVPVVELNEIFRQAQNSRIITNAHRINAGEFPMIDDQGDSTDFYFIEKNEPEDVIGLITRLVRENIPKRFGFHPLRDIQVLTPMHKGIIGAANLNHVLQQALNPGQTAVARGDRELRINDKVMQIRNNYDKDVYNGDIGWIEAIHPQERELIVNYDGRAVAYDYADLDEIVLAYAVSVHKSQGSEFPAVVIPVMTQHYILLQRNLIYTALTRGRRLVVMVGTKKALSIGIRNNKTQQRYTRLAKRLQSMEIT